MPSFNLKTTGSQAVLDVSMALGQPAVLPIYNSTNARLKQLWFFATEEGRKLAMEHNWACLREEYSFTLDGSLVYDLPSDFKGFIGSSAWDRSSQSPVIGDVGESRWQRLQIAVGVGSLNLVYRLRDGQIEFLSEPGDNDIVMPYWSWGWARDALTPFSRRDNLATDDDTILLEPMLFKAALKLRWLSENKFDTVRAEIDYQRALNSAKSRDTTAETIGIVPNTGVGFLSSANVPDTGYGP